MRELKGIFLAALVLFIFIAGVWLGTRWMKSNSAAGEENTATIVQQVQTLSDFVTVKYVLEKVVILNAPPESTLGKFFEGENRVLLLAHGIVKAGIDLKRLKPEDVKVSGKKISLRLPPPEITDAYLDEQRTKVIDWQKGFLRDFDKDLEQTARRNAVDDIRRAAREDGILNDADERAKLELALFLHQAGFEQIEFVGATAPTPANPARESVPQF
ncbi:MAG: DUF4230 domain-containing protein [Limisphaerales bacterium]